MKKLLLASALALAASVSLATTLKSGDSVAFLGDSITQFGWGRPGGYVRMCEQAFKANGLDVKIIPAGISGHKSVQMLARLEKDVINKKPTYMTLSCGVNDVWHFDHGSGVKIEDYKKNITEIVDKAQAAGIKVVILTATMIMEDVNDRRNVKLAEYNEFLRALAKEKNCALADLNAEMQKQVADYRAKTGCKKNFLTVDGVHMDFLGNRMMCETILKDGFAFDASEMGKTENAILNMTTAVRIPEYAIKGSDYMKFVGKALKEKDAPSDIVRSNFVNAGTEKVKAVLAE